MPPLSPKQSINGYSNENLTNKTSLSTVSTTLNNDEHEYEYIERRLRTESLAIKKTPWPSIIVASGLGFCSAVQFR